MVSNTAFEQAVLDALASNKEFQRSVLAELATLKAEVSTLKTEVAGLKTEVAGLKTEVATLNVRVDRLERESFLHYTSLTKDVQGVKRDVEFFSMSFDARLSVIENTMTDIAPILRMHEQRITALEARP